MKNGQKDNQIRQVEEESFNYVSVISFLSLFPDVQGI